MKIDTAMTKMKINSKELENVNKFEYLGSMLYNNGNGNKKMKRRINMALQILKQMKNMWQGTGRKTKLKLLTTCIFPLQLTVARHGQYLRQLPS